MVTKVYGKLIAKYTRTEGDTAVLNRTLLIFKRPSGLYAQLWKSGTMRWREWDANMIQSASFYNKDNDATEYRVLEYFGGQGIWGDRIDMTK